MEIIIKEIIGLIGLILIIYTGYTITKKAQTKEKGELRKQIEEIIDEKLEEYELVETEDEKVIDNNDSKEESERART